MTAYVALLRGINVGGNKTIPMAGLRELVTGLGYTDATTLLQSGNLVFRSARRAPERVEAHLEAEVKKRFGHEIGVIVRTGDDLQAIVDGNPFPAEAQRDPSRLHVFFLKTPVTAARAKALQAAIVGREVVRGDGRQLYIFYPDGMGRSKLTHGSVEKMLGARVTARNWNTVRKLKELACR